MLPTPTLFHDVPVSSAATGGKSDSYGAYHIVSIDESSFRITSLNRTFAPITATWNGSSLRAVFPNLNRSLFGVAVGSPDDSNCSLLSWRVAASAARPAQPPPPPFLRQLVYEWLPGPLPPPSAPCAFSNAVWHRVAPIGQVFTFGSLNATHVAIHSENASWPDVIATLTAPPHGDLRLVSARWGSKLCTGALRDADAVGATCANLEWDVGHAPPDGSGVDGDGPRPGGSGGGGSSDVEVWEAGPLPPPPPPPPAPCEASYTKAACAAALPPSGGDDRCKWCTSADGAHALCFHAENEPPKAAGWSCAQERGERGGEEERGSRLEGGGQLIN